MTNQGKPRGTEATRIELLDIGLNLVLERGLPVGLNIRVAEVVERAGRSLGSAYQIWDNQEHFREDVAIHLASSVGFSSTEQIMPEVMAALERGDSIHDMARSVGGSFFRQYLASPHFFVSRHFWTVAGPLPPAISDALANQMLEIQVDFEGLFVMLLEHFERRLTHGYVLQDLGRMIIAMAQGLAMKSRFPTARETSETHINLFTDALILFVDRCSEIVPDETVSDG